MTSIKTNNFNFQGVGVVVSTNVPVPPPPPVVTPRLFILIDPSLNYPQIFIENVPSNEPTEYQFDITANVQDPVTGSVQAFNIDGNGNYNNLIFDPATNRAEVVNLSSLNFADGDLEVEVEFFWKDINGVVIAQRLAVETLTLVLGCTDPTAENYNSDANIDDGSCSFAQHIPPQLVMGAQLFGTSMPAPNTTIYQYHVFIDSATSSAWAADPAHEPYTYTLQYAVDSGTEDETFYLNNWSNGFTDTPTGSPGFAPAITTNNIMNGNIKFTSPVTNSYNQPVSLPIGNHLITINTINVSSGVGSKYFGFRIKFDCSLPGDPTEFSNVVSIELGNDGDFTILN